ncbi:Peptidyl-prolyl cis-trans isomerase A precursor [Posidoniimonas polymericola]|uniref:peptidylprolyl isomerase n=2 Tax=Posidoniimonas polymericola TaxID=2528002 RepID=A0A5C5YQG7_9BACT|nr:Peptidyl-prolyl cis-trans isomerase A precursor [Posidoniimonas polymericola]
MTFEPLEVRAVLSGTPLNLDINPFGPSYPAEFVEVGDTTYFVANDGTNGRELWKTDGTAGGTSMVADIRSGAGSSYPSSLVELNGTLFFAADDGASGLELWKSDGTSEGTVLVRDIRSGVSTDTEGVTTPNSSSPRQLTVVGDTLFFVAEDGVSGRELWASNGTSAGTRLVRDIFTGNDPVLGTARSSAPIELTAVGDTLFFTAVELTNGRELWKSDGTAVGTVMVKDLYEGTYPYYLDDEDMTYVGRYPNNANPGLLTELNGELYFVASNDATGAELYKSDGTAAGTTLVKDIVDGATGAFSNSDMMVAAGDLLFFTASDGVHGNELWKSDGTAAGTVLVKDVRPGEAGQLNFYVGMTAVGDKVYFGGNDGVNGRELWVSDGSEAGTQMVADINPGDDLSGNPNSSFPAYLTDVDGVLYFSAANKNSGRELWSYDSVNGAELVEDRTEGVEGTYPINLAGVNGTLFYSSEEDGARELWTLAPEDDFNLTVVVDSEFVNLPAMIGVDASGARAPLYTWDDSGQVLFDPDSGLTLGDFFETWRTNGGLGGNNTDAELTNLSLLGNFVDAQKTLQMFVNGQLIASPADYVVQDDDAIVLVYGENPVVSLNTNFGPIVIELYEDATPGTVQNFLNYVNDGDYINSIIHRSDPDFVIQGGGFTTGSTTFTDDSQFSQVPTDAQIANEPGISNLRGTVAMAKLGGNPNSATSQFFFNLSDDNTFLDSASNNAFTVFGQVLDMTTVDEIASHTVDTSSDPPFGELPLGPDNTLTVVESIEGYGEVTGIAYLDANLNGVFDAGDSAITGAMVFVDGNNNGVLDSGEAVTGTDAEGRYRVQAAPGSHQIAIDFAAAGFPVTGVGQSVDVRIGETVTGIDYAGQFLAPLGGVDLNTASDTGDQDGDNVTSLNNASPAAALQFTVTNAFVGAEVQIFAGDVLIGSATAQSSTVVVTTNGSVALSDGQHAITAVQSVGGVVGDPTAALAITVDASAPAAITSAAPEVVALEGEPFTYDVQSADEGQAGVRYSLSGEPSGMSINPTTGLITWDAGANDMGEHAFMVLLTDAAGNQVSQMVDLTVLAPAPAFPDSYQTDEDTPLTVIAAQGVLTNDGDADSDVTAATVANGPLHGTLDFNSDGSFTYTPDADFAGEDSFTYVGSTGTETTNTARVTIVVNGVQDPPEPVGDSYQVNEDATLTVAAAAGVLSNDADADGDSLTAALVDGPAHGTLSLQPNGSFTYTPAANYFGPDSFTYTASDSQSVSAPVTVSLTVNAVNDPPVTSADQYSVNEDGVLTVAAADGLLKNDADIDSQITAVLKTGPAHGVLSLQPDGSFTYTPSANFFGADSFTYAASDGVAESSSTLVVIDVVGQADPPTANADAFTAPNDASPQTLDVLANDTSAPDGVQGITITAVTQASSGGVVGISNGAISYASASGYVGVETFTYTIQDTDGLTSTATVTVTVEEAADNVLSGYVYVDANGNGQRDAGEAGVPGVEVTLTGTPNSTSAAAVDQTVTTGDDGAYSFIDLPAGTYQLNEQQPAALQDGDEETTVAGAMVGDDTLSNLVLSGGVTYEENNFGEASLLPQYHSIRWYFASSTDQQAIFREIVTASQSSASSAQAATTADSTAGSSPAASEAPVAAIALAITAPTESVAVPETDATATAAASAQVAAFTAAEPPAATTLQTYQDVPLTIVQPGFREAPPADTDEQPAALPVVVSPAVDPIAVESIEVVQQPAHGSLAVLENLALQYRPSQGYLGVDQFSISRRYNDGSIGVEQITVTVVSPQAAAFAMLASSGGEDDDTLIDLPMPETADPPDDLAFDVALADDAVGTAVA